jgi:hypothetical protein
MPTQDPPPPPAEPSSGRVPPYESSYDQIKHEDSRAGTTFDRTDHSKTLPEK